MLFGEKFMNIIHKIYSGQSARIRVNNDLMEKCPLSPLLFISVLEFLDIQRDDNIKGIKIKNCHFKFRAFADDIVL